MRIERSTRAGTFRGGFLAVLAGAMAVSLAGCDPAGDDTVGDRQALDGLMVKAAATGD